MVQGVYIGRSDTGNYDLISTGDYINPISSTFKLKDTKASIERIEPLYLIVNQVSIEYTKLTVMGQVTSVRCFLSWDQATWSSEIISTELIEVPNSIRVKPFFLKIIVDDFLEYFKLVGENVYRQYKIRVMWI